MKRFQINFLFLCLVACLMMYATSCKKSTNDSGASINANNDSANATNISDRFRFLKSTKIQGSIPNAAPGNTLKISFEDTLYLPNEVKGPVKFLHENTSPDVAGMYLQVKGSNGSSNASYYYDVPELKDMDDNDTVSVILMGFSPGDLLSGTVPAPPGGSTSFVFDVVMTPYDVNKQPIASAVKPVKISKQRITENGTSGLCGLELPPGDFWRWDLSLIEDASGNGLLTFYNDPKKVWGANGQFITGCCINGVSSYNTVLNCENDPTKARRKLFPTFFQHQESSIKFLNDGSYAHLSKQVNVNPAPDRTNFCSASQGAVDFSLRQVTETGTWTITRVAPYKGDSLRLTTFRTNSSGGTGMVTPGGYIKQLECNLLVLVKPSNEGVNQDLVSFYSRVNTSLIAWYLF